VFPSNSTAYYIIKLHKEEAPPAPFGEGGVSGVAHKKRVTVKTVTL
jgi:hypothetical protein